ncbi:MAG: outer membrane beta-barrel protein [Saprospiraceae bacterium]|nr:outer membrane beta-barrel protein [Saprospiraceae bacterium]
MMRIIFMHIIVLWGIGLSAQKYNIKGVIRDTLGDPLIAATVMLMDKDSILIEYTQTDMKGSFEFKSVADKSCLIKTSYLGYFPLTIGVNYENKNVVDLGTLRMVEIAKELMEIVIKEAKAPLRLRGDTVEYDASQFKVPQGSTLEDLLRRLPGLEVSQDGSIVADGKGVSKLTVDGKTFFSEDPKFAIKNLPAEGVSKVQVFDKKNEEALLTGKSTASEEKTMNIELKEEFKKGGFGKVTAGGGSENRKELKGNYNKFDSKHQISFVGVANNTGRNGLSWDDYQDFMGSNSWNDNDDYDYGFGGGFSRYYSGGGSGLEGKVSEAFWSGNTGGFPTSIIGGVNYNYDHKKNKLAGRYFFQNTGNNKETFTDSRSFLSGFFLDNNRSEIQEKGSINHRAETMYQHDIDSLLTAIVTADIAVVDTDNFQNGIASISRDGDQITSTSSFDNSSDLSGRLINTSLLLRKKFKKAGRAIGINGSYLKTDISDFQKRFSDNLFYNDSGINDSTFVLKQFNHDTLDKSVIKANVMFSEPFSKKLFFKLFYNFSSRNENGTRYVDDQNETDNNLNRNNGLSRIYENTILSQRSGSSLTFSHNGLNFTAGAAFQSFNLNGTYQSPDPIFFNGKVDNKFNLWLPYAEFNGSITRNTWVNANYGISASEPTIENLLPVVDYSNPLFITQGNPNLVPTLNHRAGVWFNHSWPADAIRINIGTNYQYFEDQIILKQEVDENLVTKSQPVNYSGGNQLWNSFGLSFPIIRNKIKIRTNLSQSGGKSFAFVNDVLNKTNTVRWSPSINIDFTPSEKTAIYVSSNMSFSSTDYDINTSQNQDITSHNYNIDFNTNFARGWFWNSSLRYSMFKNERFGIEQDIPIINLSIYKQILKGNKGEIRLSLYDALNKNILINQSTSVSRVFDSRTPSLARYVMLSFSYNIKGMKSTVARNDYW